MNVWENAVITIKGLALLSKLAEGNSLNITRAETGAGYVTPGLLSQQNAVTNPKQALIFREIAYPEEGKCKLPCYLTNDGVYSGYTATQVGIYAEDPDEGEILYFIAQAASGAGTIVPSDAEMPGYSAEWSFYFQFGQADGVNVTVDPSNTVTRGELDEMLKDVALIYRGTLTASNAKNADAYTDLGIYKVYLDGVSGGDFNFPTPYGMLVVNASTDGTSPAYVSQTFYSISNSKFFFRSSPNKGGTWDEWTQLAAQKDLLTHTSNKNNPHGVSCAQIGAIPTANSIPKGTDLNTVVTSGMYRINENPVNAPADVAYGQMIVVRGGNDTVAQMVFPYNQSKMFFRTGNPPEAGGTGTWKAWTQVYSDINKPTAEDVGAIPKEEQFTAVMTTISHSTEEAIDSYYDNYSLNFEGRTKYEATVFHNVPHSVLGGGLFYLSGLKNNDEYEWQEIKSYTSLGAISYFSRSKVAGQWTKWSESTHGVAKIHYGTYVGTGTCGEENPNTLTFPFEPMHVNVFSTTNDGGAVGELFIKGATMGMYYTGQFIEFNGKTIKWYDDSTAHQFNNSGVTYGYVAIG